MLNTVVLMGRLVSNPELKCTNTGQEVVSFCIAVERDYVKKGEERKADFINVVAWEKTAAFVCRYFGKGAMIAIEGRLQTRTYQAKDGSNRTVTEVVAKNVSFTGEKRDAETSEPAVPASSTDNRSIDNLTDTSAPVTPDGDIPF